MTVKRLLQCMIAILCITHLNACGIIYPLGLMLAPEKGKWNDSSPKCPNPELMGRHYLIWAAATKGDLEQFKNQLSIEQAKPYFRENLILEVALDLAATCGHKNIVEVALTHNPNLTWRNGGEGAFIFRLVKSAQPQLLDLIVKRGYDVNSSYGDFFNRTPIFAAICSPARKENITILLRNGASKEVKNKSGNTPLEHAIQCKDKEAIRRLQQDPNQPEEEPKPFSGWLN